MPRPPPLLLALLALAGANAQAAPPTHLAGYSTQVALTTRWGDGPGQLGRIRPREANPKGPSSLAADASGALFVLDEVNYRVVVFEPGGSGWSFDLPSPTFQDIALDDQGRVLLLDRLVSRSVWYFDIAGRPLREVGLEGPGIEEGGGVTGLFPGPDGLWVEYDNAHHVRIADREGNPDPDRPARLGRPTGDGRLLLANIAGPRSVALWAQAPSATDKRWLTSVQFDLPVFRIDGLESDSQGRLFLAVDLLDESPVEPFEVLRELQQVVILAPDGTELQRLDLPPLDAPEEQLRPVRLGADGALYQLRCEQSGAVVRRVAR